MSIIIFIIILAILVLVHEFGHFIVAKKSGILVEEFGLGFPPRLFGKKIGETTYSINWIPFGGFVKIFGENSHVHEPLSGESKTRSLVYKPRGIQALVLVAGVTMNIIFAWLMLSLGFWIGLPSPVDHTGPGQVVNPQLTITDVLENSPAQKAGLNSGDVITQVVTGSGTLKGMITSEEVKNLIETSTGDVEITYVRGTKKDTISVTPQYDVAAKERLVGIAMDEIGVLKLSAGQALIQGLSSTWLLTKGTAVGLFKFLVDLVRFKSDLSQVAGPIGIAGVVGQAQSLGFVYVLSVMALISINLAIINLLPFPALDGGRLLMVGIEAIIRRPISPKVVRWTNNIGFAFLIILMVVVTTHDILKLI